MVQAAPAVFVSEPMGAEEEGEAEYRLEWAVSSHTPVTSFRYSTVQINTVQHSTVQYSTVPDC